VCLLRQFLVIGMLSLYLPQALETVLAGVSAKDVFREMTFQRQKILIPLARLVRDREIQITPDDALGLMSSGARESTRGPDADLPPLEELVADPKFLKNLGEMYGQAIETYAAREQTLLAPIECGEIDRKIEEEEWTRADSPGETENDT
jgi:hypothetical protein